MSFTATHLTTLIGTEVHTDKADLLSGADAAELRRLLEARGVLIFREIHLTDQEQVRAAASLGNIRQEGKEGIFKVTLDPKENAQADYLIGTFHWHIDGTHDDVPCLASLLSGRKLSATGGQTEFTNTYASYEALPESEEIHRRHPGRSYGGVLSARRASQPEQGAT